MRTDTTGVPRVEGRGQVCEYIEHLRATSGPAAVDLRRAHTLRVRIHADSYRAQAYGLVERWDGTKWHQVVYVNGSDLKDTDIGYRFRHETTEAEKLAYFQADRDRLLALAGEVL